MAGSTRQSREHKKWLAARRAQFRLQQRFEYIDWDEDILSVESEALLSGKVTLEIEPTAKAAAQSIIHVTINDETSSDEDQNEDPNTLEGDLVDETSADSTV